jgi:hypothetical protein
MGPPVEIAFSWFRKVAEKTMVYGRYNELVFMGIIEMVYFGGSLTGWWFGT